MEREVTSSYSINSSRSHISYISNMNYLLHDSNLQNQANLLDMLRNLRQEDEQVDELGETERLPSNTNSSDSVNSYDLFAEMSLLSNNKQTTSNLTNDDQLFEDPEFLLLNHGRASTAPARPLNEAEEFKWSAQFSNLKKAVMYCNSLIILQPDTKFDVDSEEGAEICKKFLENLEKLIKVKLV
jgi:hypothetical protein